MPLGHRGDCTIHFLQESQFLIEARMRVRLAGQYEVHLVFLQQRTHGLMTVQIVGQYRNVPGLKALTVALYPTLDRPLLAILLVMSILWRDELGVQADHMLFTWRTQHREHHQV
jgi:hypothetical protein